MEITEQNWDSTCSHCGAVARIEYIEKGPNAGSHYVECPECWMCSPIAGTIDEACQLWDDMTFRSIERTKLRRVQKELQDALYPELRGRS